MESQNRGGLRLFSLITGYNSYIATGFDSQRPGSTKQRPTSGVHEHTETSVRFVPIQQGVRRTEDIIAKYRQIILRTMPQTDFEWPIDLVELGSDDEQSERTRFLVYPQLGFPKMSPLRNILYQPITGDVLDWRRPQIQSLCLSFLRRMEQLDQSGYLYRCFDMDRIYYDSNHNLYFGFSPELVSIEHNQPVNVESIPKEFALPSIFREQSGGEYPLYGDYYSAAAILFRLMIGRLPYEGSGLMAFGTVFDPDWDTDPGTHNDYFRHYVQFPHFIFDEKDQSNQLGVRTSDDGPRERWSALPQGVRDMFYRTLEQKNAEGNGNGRYSPQHWMNALQGCFAQARR